MDVAWRFRIMLFTALALILFGDLFGYGSVRGVKSDPNRPPTGSNKFQQKNAEIEINEDTDLSELSATTLQERRDLIKTQLTDAIKDSCLPKMLCEMAAKPPYLLTEKEKDLIHLIRSSSLSFPMKGSPSKWHFAAHMGELLRHTGDENSGPMGCANLWPNCPISSKKLMRLSYKVKF